MNTAGKHLSNTTIVTISSAAVLLHRTFVAQDVAGVSAPQQNDAALNLPKPVEVKHEQKSDLLEDMAVEQSRRASSRKRKIGDTLVRMVSLTFECPCTF